MSSLILLILLINYKQIMEIIRNSITPHGSYLASSSPTPPWWAWRPRSRRPPGPRHTWWSRPYRGCWSRSTWASTLWKAFLSSCSLDRGMRIGCWMMSSVVLQIGAFIGVCIGYPAKGNSERIKVSGETRWRLPSFSSNFFRRSTFCRLFIAEFYLVGHMFCRISFGRNIYFVDFFWWK